MTSKSQKVLISSILLALISGCDSSSSNTSYTPKNETSLEITSSKAVGGDADTMDECKTRLDKTAKKYNLTYTVTFDERDYFSAKIVKNGIQTDLLAVCTKKDDYYTAMFQVPD